MLRAENILEELQENRLKYLNFIEIQTRRFQANGEERYMLFSGNIRSGRCLLQNSFVLENGQAVLNVMFLDNHYYSYKTIIVDLNSLTQNSVRRGSLYDTNSGTKLNLDLDTHIDSMYGLTNGNIALETSKMEPKTNKALLRSYQIWDVEQNKCLRSENITADCKYCTLDDFLENESISYIKPKVRSIMGHDIMGYDLDYALSVSFYQTTKENRECIEMSVATHFSLLDSASILPAISRNSSLETLIMDKSLCTKSTLTGLTNLIRCHPTLKELDLSKVQNLTYFQQVQLFMAIKSSASLQQVQGLSLPNKLQQRLERYLARNREKSNRAPIQLNMEPRVEQQKIKIPDDYRCPISCQIMLDPVIAADGHTYEREEIEECFKHSNRSPKENTELDHKHVLPNKTLKGLIQSFLDEHSELRKSDELYASKAVEQQCLALIQSVEQGKLKALLKSYPHLLVEPIGDQPLMTIVLSQPHISILEIALGIYQETLWHQIPEQGEVSWIQMALTHQGIEGARILSQALDWIVEDWQDMLEHAVQHNQNDIISDLLQLGASFTKPNAEGFFPLEQAMKSQVLLIPQLLNTHILVDMLIAQQQRIAYLEAYLGLDQFSESKATDTEEYQRMDKLANDGFSQETSLPPLSTILQNHGQFARPVQTSSFAIGPRNQSAELKIEAEEIEEKVMETTSTL